MPEALKVTLTDLTGAPAKRVPLRDLDRKHVCRIDALGRVRLDDAALATYGVNAPAP